MTHQQPPGYPQLPPQYPRPVSRAGHARWLVPALTGAVGIVAGGAIVAAATAGHDAARAPSAPARAAATAPQGYHDAATLEHDLKAMLSKRLASPSGQFYDPGVTVKSLVCVETSRTAATCLYKLSDGQSDTDSVVISPDGSRFITR